jgi:hypothetical protein
MRDFQELCEMFPKIVGCDSFECNCHFTSPPAWIEIIKNNIYEIKIMTQISLRFKFN